MTKRLSCLSPYCEHLQLDKKALLLICGKYGGKGMMPVMKVLRKGECQE